MEEVVKKMNKVWNFDTRKLFRNFGDIDQRQLAKILLGGLAVFVWVFAGMTMIMTRRLAQENVIIVSNVKTYNEKLEQKIRSLVAGHPIEKMSKLIAGQNNQTAAYLVAIAKKESNWGERVPVLNGADCFNYWGFRGKRDKMGSGGHTCFDSPRDAVQTVAARITELNKEYGRNTPEEMVVWKCGYNCDGHSSKSVLKWISDVDYYYQQMQAK